MEKSRTNLLTYALFAAVGATAVALLLSFSPFPSREHFSTVAVDRDLMPKCFTRDADAQNILLMLRDKKASDLDAFSELSLILQKMLCIDADVTGAGAGGYQSFQLPFVTQHDLEPPASFVGRCLKGAVRSRDLEIMMSKLESRGNVLIQSLCDPGQKAECFTKFHGVVMRATRNIGKACMNNGVGLDRPSGPRDPGYSIPAGLEEQGPYSIRGDVQYI
jgi:hypothetical protein